MIEEINITIAPNKIQNNESISEAIIQFLSLKKNQLTGFEILKKSLDARSKNIKFLLKLKVWIDEPKSEIKEKIIEYQNVSNAPSAVIVGAGPAGLFCALQLIELGIKPIIIERGKDVRSRRRDLAILNKEGILNTESNYCFGEGGAGTYSDGKLYTRSGKRGNINKVLQIFCQFGASQQILIDAHPHIGTNKLPDIIVNMRNKIIECGGEIFFETKLIDFIIENNCLKKIVTNNGIIENKYLILATGHSARDIYQLLFNKNILLETKPLAIGVRIEHPQEIIDSIQYGCVTRDEFLPPASYSLVEQVNNRGVFSFCMCPGGIIATASTQQNSLVVNGWSPSKRNNAFANSGMVVSVHENDFKKYSSQGALSSMYFQNEIEEKAFKTGGGKFVAPAQRMIDFTEKKLSNSLPKCSYIPGIKSADLQDVLPLFIYKNLAEGFKLFDKKMKGYLTNEAIVIATESRTSSPVRIPRDSKTLMHPQVSGLFPCAEGAGYAGGIVSAAMDGEKIAIAVYQKMLSS